ncbi:hypothetical protein MCUN1_000743 [Malassezia cuniculi]|uniref:Post-SET domain-containing protein n=1 Tax=Malassezia cuniculi TaxID=948313 RepID=A0AAF0ESV7_9BASI|nr:hypothetical protein MCUN1_000743 [Malassezia cuniculi]
MTSSYEGHKFNGNADAAKLSHVPTHPDTLEVKFQSGNYNSYAVAKRAFSKGDVIGTFAAATYTDTVRYSSVQVATNKHIELNSDFLYLNHSCDPSVNFDVSSGTQPSEYVAIANKDIAEGDILTFCTLHSNTTVYPSTEWEMQQPFDCTCGAKQCLGRIRGAKFLTEEELKPYFINGHIKHLKSVQ